MRYIIILGLLILFGKFAFAEPLVTIPCQYLADEADRSDLRVFNRIKIDVNEYKLKKEILRKFKFSGDPIYAESRKWFKAKVSIQYGERICSLKAKIRLAGDLLDHIEINPKNTHSSLLVVLEDGAINGIVRFKLLIPASRNEYEEIFAANTLSSLGYLAPRTGLVNLKINDTSYAYIIQEDIRKEFLEYNSKVEGPLFEGNERFGLSQKMSTARMANPSWADKSQIHLKIAAAAFNMLNYAYLVHGNHVSTENPDPLLDLTSVKYPKGNFPWAEEMNSYDALIFALRAQHLLSRDDRRLYFDSVYGKFYPIYYDGSPGFIRNNKTPSQVTQSAKLGVVEAKKRLSMLDPSDLRLQLEKSGLDLNLDTLISLLKRLSKNLDEILLIDSPALENSLSLNQISSGFKATKVNKFILWDDVQKNWQLCSINFTECQSSATPLSGAFLEGKFPTSNDFDKTVFLGYLGKNESSGKLEAVPYPFSILNERFFIIEGNVRLYATKNPIVKIDFQGKNIEIKLIDSHDSVLITGGYLANWHVKIQGSSATKSSDSARMNLTGLTGCINFRDVILSNFSLESFDTQCEDAINLTRATGNISHLKINKSHQDGLDMDFSNLIINNIYIKNVGNDCIDLSYGTYRISNAVLDSCKDKGVSVGESSNAEFGKSFISNVETGIAVKDSSMAKLQNVSVKGSKSCLSLYRKKLEFLGAFVKTKNLKCHSGQTNIQKNSVVKSW